MFRSRIIYRLVGILMIFALMIIAPYSLTIITQVEKLIEQEEQIEQVRSEEYNQMHKEFGTKLIEHTVPFVFYSVVLAFILSIFFLRKVLIALRNLKEASRAVKEGNFDIRLPVLATDELGDVTHSFNEMAEELRAKTEELKKKDLYVNTMLDPLWVVDEDDRITDINPAFTKLLGHSREEILGISIFDLLDDKNAAIMKKQIELRRELGESSIYELSILSRSGVQIPVLVSGAPIYSGGRVVAKIGIIKDFREQSSLRQELQQSLDYIETIMNSIPDELVVIDRNYRIIMANRIAMMNADHDLIGDLCHRALHGSSMPCWTSGSECPSQYVFSSGRNHRTVHEHTDSSGNRKYHEIIASPIKDSAGNVLHVVELLRDVTDRMKNEAQVSRKNKELTALHSISGILNRSLKSDEIFMRVLDKMIEMLNMDGGGIFFLDEASRELTCQYHKGISDEYVKMIGRIRLGDDLPGMVAATGQILTTADISKDQRVERSVIKHSGIRGYCCIPVKGKEKIIGVFCLFSFSPHTFTLEEENILSSIGEMTGMALENIRLYEKMRSLYEHQRTRWKEEHQQLLKLSAGLGAAVDITEILKMVLSLIRQLFGADFVWLLADTETHDLALMSATETTGREDSVIYTADVSSIERYSLSLKSPVIISDIRTEDKFYVAPEISMYRAAVSVPMFMGEKPVGVCTFYYMLNRDFKEEDLHFMEIVTNMISVAKERSEFYIRAGRERELADAILQSVHDAIITVDLGGSVISVNDSFERLTGIRPSMAIGVSLSELFSFSDDNSGFREIIKESIDSARLGRSAARAALLTTVYGMKLAVTITSSPVLDRGTVTGIVSLIRDVSRENELDRMKTELIRSVSHEFRTPLAAIVGMTEMLINGDVEEEKMPLYLDTIHNEGLRLSKMVAELLSIARIESGKEALKLCTVNVESLFRDIREIFRTQLLKKNAVLNYDTGGVASITADEEKIRQLICNFIDNSLTFSDEGCIINVAVRRKGQIVELTIEDNGWGIPGDEIPRLAEPFFRGRHGDRVKGTGLGLALCDEILKMHGGSMDIASSPGKGTVITIQIPYREAV